MWGHHSDLEIHCIPAHVCKDRGQGPVMGALKATMNVWDLSCFMQSSCFGPIFKAIYDQV